MASTPQGIVNLALKTMKAHLKSNMQSAAKDLVQDAWGKYESPWGGFTGNAQTGVVAAIYDGNSFERFETSSMDPLQGMMEDGKSYYRDDPWSGPARYGWHPMPNPKGGHRARKVAKDLSKTVRIPKRFALSIVVQSGAPYDTYIEQAMHGNVLTSTYANAAQVVKSSLERPLP